MSHVFHSEYPAITPVEEPIHSYVLGRAAAHGDHPALIDGTDGTTLSHTQLDHHSRRIAAALAETGLRKGDVLALHSPNSLAFPAVFYAASRCGAAVTTVHPLATAEELGKQLGDSGARWLVTVAALLDTARAAADLAGGITEIFVCDRAAGHRSLLDLLASTAPEPDVTIDPAQDLAVLPYSSGTTGTPKGVMLTHRSIATNLAQLDSLISSGPGDRVLAVLPFFHLYGLTSLMNAPLRNGSTVVVLPRFDLEQFLAAIAEHRITAVYAAPPIVLALAKHPLVARYDLSSLEYLVSAAAPLDAELAAACSRRLGLPPILQAYGMTELSPGSHAVPRGTENAPPGAVGKLLPNTEMRIVSLETGEDLPPGHSGEIVLRGPQVMKGYLGRPAETDAMITPDGWLHTGDVGRTDENGWLHVVDRVKELIKYKGYQVAPAELEALLLTHDDITDAAVIGVPDEAGNELPKAYVVRREGAELSADDILTYAAARVAPYKRIRHVEFTEAVPRAVTGKILRRELRERERRSVG
ncbi:4-coumarate--CoA ligase family protein [Streptomyces sp. NPDC050161]|uniref:4-coumarate--CoA ligase family protein n=1 Tax=Streptomyces sp. NPDC050161 TaxID=3365604 RepID=UPI00379BCE8B